MSATVRALLLLPVVLLFVPLSIAEAWDTGSAALVLGLFALLLLGALTTAVRMMLPQRVPERHAKLLAPRNGDMAWQSLVVAAANFSSGCRAPGLGVGDR